MDKFDTFFNNKSRSYKDKTVAVTGATGTLGYQICNYLLQKEANIILIGRNEAKLKEKTYYLRTLFKHSEVSYLVCDFSSLEQVKLLGERLVEEKIDYLFNNAGCYHQPVKMIDQYDVTFVTNFISPIFLTKYLCDNIEHIKIIQTTSLSHSFVKIIEKDVQRTFEKSKIKRYSNSKRFLTLSTLILQQTYTNKLFLVHPGVSATGLFNKEKGNFSSAFDKIVNPLLKVFAMKPKKAALCIALAPSYKCKKDTIIVPNGAFNIWGFPKEKTIKLTKFKHHEIKLAELYIKKI